MSGFQVSSVKLVTGDVPIVGITLEPYVLIRRGDSTVTADDVPEEGSAEGVFQLRTRWFRSTIPAAGRGSVCCMHPDKEATVQCTVCLRSKVPQHLSYHCSAECFRLNWQRHVDLHVQAIANGTENGYDHVRPSGTLSTSEMWVEVMGLGRSYTPTMDDVGFQLKIECSVVHFNGHHYVEIGRPVAAVTSRVRPQTQMPQRSMVQLPHPAAVQNLSHGRFTVLTYNLLADLYAKSDAYSHAPAWVMAWHYRKTKILAELTHLKPDIMCLQEVQADHYSDFLQPELAKAGYVGIYKRKTAEVYAAGGLTCDGCATFYRRDRFSMVKKYEVEFNKAAMSLADQISNPQQKKATMNRLLKDNVALIAVLEALDHGPDQNRGGKQLLCVANTHIHANPELADVKLWQVHTLLKGLEKIAHSADIPMVVAGDFNSTPGSAAHSLLVRGRVEPSGLDESSDPLGILRAPEQKLSHSLPLSSAYGALAEAPPVSEALRRQRGRLDLPLKEPAFTNINREFRGTLDYVLYTRDSLQPRALLELPAENEVIGMPNNLTPPNAAWPSDHIALMAEFQVMPGPR